MPIEQWFPTPIYYGDVTGDRLNAVQDELLACCNSLSFQQNEAWGSTEHNLSDVSFRTSVINDRKLTAIADVIDYHLKQYIPSEFHQRKYDIVESWFTKTLKNQYSHQHHHGRWDIAGCYYVQTNGSDGSIHFHNPTSLTASYIFANHVDQTVSYAPVVGRILLFPAWLAHNVSENRTDSERVSIAFNIAFDRT